ncbi:FmdB family zinc ribbon protein [Mycobacterium arosiense]|uniref:FmdB family transcriptional regulator n=1 Tax=Mycobacterium arosiense ATCC BAA-1401 = DSM 45069 TaxID=1265311 RepID=A0A1W9Z5G9_MYCAI|nr:FmdB family zinc ribbon protein [Mycobacterium arosiense]ORA07555.1 FmdB family transcriptional regulator [Mycobacterium arosiense ATCC BAA-1401 = DSM 45069]
MPTYSYQCTECDDRFDIVQAFTEDALTTCKRCSGRLRKRFNSVGVVFKGSGFYRTDSRESGKKSGSTNGSSSSDSGSSTSNSSEKSGSGSSEKSGSGSSEKSSSAAASTAAATS